MAFGDPVVGGTNVKMTLVYGLGKAGWSESYIVNVDGGADPIASAQQAMVRIINLRVAILPGDVTMEAMRAATLQQTPSKTDIAYVPDYGLNVGGGILLSANPNLAWSVEVSNEDFFVSDTRFYNAWIPQFIPYNGSGVIGVLPPPAVKAWSVSMQTILRSANSFGGGVCRFVQQSYVKPLADPAYKLFDLATIDTGLDGRLRVTALTADIGAAAVGRILMVHAQRKRCVKGVSGRWRIKAMEPEGGTLTRFVLDTKPCCANAGDLEGLKGKAQVYAPAFYQVKWFTLGRSLTKKVGRAFFVSRGRRPAGCC